MELLEDVKDPELRLKIIDQQPQELLKKAGKPTSTQDLIIEIDNLKKEIQDIKRNNKRLDQKISRIEKGKEVMTPHQDIEIIGIDDNFLSTLEIFITQKWHVKIRLLIDNYYSKEFTALVDSGADLNVIQEGLIPIRYFHKTTHTLSHAGGNNLQINYKLPKAKVEATVPPLIDSTSETEGNIPPSSYAKILASVDDEASYTPYLLNQKQEVILILEEKDSRWSNEPWILMRRYMGEESYPSRMYKGRTYYEQSVLFCK
ncbi:hypothetical protein QQ045_017687 [Rhodiola kirilowii]